MSFEFDDVMEVLKVVKECQDAELHIDTGDLKLSIFKGDIGDSGRSLVDFNSAATANQAATAQASAAEAAAPTVSEAPPAPAQQAETAKDGPVDEDLVPITANVTSLFYRSPSPDEPSFVEVGDLVEGDSVVCLLEVMKCFRQVTAEVRGRVEKICVENNELVEEGTVLFLIRPE